MEKKRISSGFKYLAAFLLPTIFTLMFVGTLDNDTWFVLAEGRYIAENGVFYTDVLSMHQGLDLTVQQYGFAVIFWWVYSALGPVGLYLMMLGLNILIMFLIYKICMLLSNKNVNLSLLVMIVVDLLLIPGFVTTRAQMVSYTVFLAVIYVMELYIKTNKMKYLWWIPVLSFIQINMHGSLWWMIFLVMGAYFVDGIKKPKLHLQGYRKKPIVIVGLIAFLVGFLNPYSYKMVAFIFTSYGATEIVNMVDEMRPFNLRSAYNIILFLAIASSMVLYLFGNKKQIRVRYILLYLGFLALGLNTVKGLSQFILVMLLPMALMYKNVRVEKVIEDAKARRAMMTWCGITATCVAMVLLLTIPSSVENHPRMALVEAIDALDASVEQNGEDKDTLKIYTGYNWGGYAEYRGYKPFLDPRAEVFLKDDILKEWNNFILGRMELEEFLNKYDFDYLLADAHDAGMYKMRSEDYEVLYSNEDEGFKLLRRLK